MRWPTVCYVLIIACNSKIDKTEIRQSQVNVLPVDHTIISTPYEVFKDSLQKRKQRYFRMYAKNNFRDNKEAKYLLTDYWVQNIADSLFCYWKNTPWDFNGTSTIPQQGTIACGYFVTTILQHMGVKLERIKLSICPSSRMMQKLTPGQKLLNLSYLNVPDFEKRLRDAGKGIYIIGLDYHTGFIVNDGDNVWFIHSNYIQRKGVVKENVLKSSALNASKTKWLVSLTGDAGFIKRWLDN